MSKPTKKPQSKDPIRYRRILHYFWQALMRYKLRTFALLLLIPVNIFISNIIWPRGTSDIIGLMSSGVFDLAAFTPILLWTLLPMLFNNIVLVRILDWLDWSIDAKAGEYLSQLAFTAVINQSMTFHANHFSGSLTSAANKFPSAFINLKSNFVWDIYPLLLTVGYTLVATFLICPPIAGILLIMLISYTIAATITYVKTSYREEDMSEAETHQTGQLADAITNITSVKSYAHESHEETRFKRATARTRRATFGLAKASFSRNLLLNVVLAAAMVGVIFLLIMSHDWFGLDVANVLFLFSLATSMTRSMWQINHILRVFNRCFGDANQMTEILDLPYIIDDKTDRPLQVTDARLEFSHISFTHEEQKDKLFEDLSLTVTPGTSLGLVGVSGSGKSTLTKLLLRFADVKKGAIFIDGQDIRDVTQRSLREAIAYVPQEASLFHRSIYDNIAYGRPGATQEEVYHAAHLARADEFIKNLPDGYDTLVGERGIKLSGGQRQRIAIARAILKDAPILVLDEATSALDSESEAHIQDALAHLMQGRTSIVVAHRLSTIAGLDRIVVLRDGRVIEQGTHAELLAKNGEYAKLWSRQSGAFLD